MQPSRPAQHLFVDISRRTLYRHQVHFAAFTAKADSAYGFGGIAPVGRKAVGQILR
jgi:hypothetical protein